MVYHSVMILRKVAVAYLLLHLRRSLLCLLFIGWFDISPWLVFLYSSLQVYSPACCLAFMIAATSSLFFIIWLPLIWDSLDTVITEHRCSECSHAIARFLSEKGQSQQFFRNVTWCARIVYLSSLLLEVLLPCLVTLVASCHFVLPTFEMLWADLLNEDSRMVVDVVNDFETGVGLRGWRLQTLSPRLRISHYQVIISSPPQHLNIQSSIGSCAAIIEAYYLCCDVFSWRSACERE